jgi:hypothetical protein
LFGVKIQIQKIRIFLRITRFSTLRLNSPENLFPVNLDFGWRIYTDAYLITFNAQHCHYDVFSYDELFSYSPGQNKHGYLPLVPGI